MPNARITKKKKQDNNTYHLSDVAMWGSKQANAKLIYVKNLESELLRAKEYAYHLYEVLEQESDDAISQLINDECYAWIKTLPQYKEQLKQKVLDRLTIEEKEVLGLL